MTFIRVNFVELRTEDFTRADYKRVFFVHLLGIVVELLVLVVFGTGLMIIEVR